MTNIIQIKSGQRFIKDIFPKYRIFSELNDIIVRFYAIDL